MKIPVNATVDIISLANVASFIETNGRRVKSKSAILDFTISMVDNSILGKAPRFMTEQIALDYLASLDIGISSYNKTQTKKVNRLSDVVIPQVSNNCAISQEEALKREAQKVMAQIDFAALAAQANSEATFNNRQFKQPDPDETISPEKRLKENQENYADYVKDCEARSIVPQTFKDYIS